MIGEICLEISTLMVELLSDYITNYELKQLAITTQNKEKNVKNKL